MDLKFRDMNDHQEQLLTELQEKSLKFGVKLTSEQLKALQRFCLEIIDYSKHTNLVGKAELPVLLQDHVLDSLALVPLIENTTDNKAIRLIDIGSGGGFPAFVLAIALPNLQVTMVEALAKKCRFLEEAARKLTLEKRISVQCQRAEELAHERGFREQFNVGTARAVGTFDLSAELVMPFLSVGGKFLAQKSAAQRADEVQKAEGCLSRLSGKLCDVKDLDENILGKSRIVLIAEKIRPSDVAYPRTWTKIKSRPLV
ncbi:MAG TPA: 16S rRNA (guanine(527)-N(7))-methyltransferase RsmG [Oculatellaceae cyanobacterium]